VRFDRQADGRCAFYLRVVTAHREYTLPLGPHLLGDLGKLQVNEPIRDWPFQIPAVEAIVDLGGHGNLIALGDMEGASNLFVDFVGLQDGRLRVIRTQLSFGGPMTAVTTASCTRGGPLRGWSVWNAWTRKHPNRWAFSIDTYRRHGWRIVAVAHRNLYGSYKQMWRAAHRAGIRKTPLSGCSIARNPGFNGAAGI
jgi:hypothetical protein